MVVWYPLTMGLIYLPPLSGYELLCSSPVCVGTLGQVASRLFYQYFSSLKNFSLAFALLFFFSADYCYAVDHVHGNKLPSGMEGEVLPNFICFVRILIYLCIYVSMYLMFC